jgi:RNA polymerase sigma factor (sigma-70 family)
MDEALREFVACGSAEAFRRVVETYADSVYSQSLRQLREPALAEDVTQGVFMLLAKKAKTIPGNVVLAGWLFKAVRYDCANTLRRENRRRRWEREAMRMRPEIVEAEEGDRLWEEAQPLLNDALARLSGADRDAILLRYFHRQSLREVGMKMGVSEEAAKQRVFRAVEKLRSWFAGRGLAVPSITIGEWLGAAVKPAPPGLVGVVARVKLPGMEAARWGWFGGKVAAGLAAAVVGIGGAAVIVALVDGGHPARAATSENAAGATTSPTTGPSTQPVEMTVTVRAYVDGRSRLSLKGNTASWQNFEYAAPGKMGGHNDPTIINGVRWIPTWEDSDVSPEVRLAKSKSDTFNQVEPAVAAAAMVVTVEKIRCRENASVVQQPSAENDFTTIVEFDDSRTGGADWYELKLTFSPPAGK